MTELIPARNRHVPWHKRTLRQLERAVRIRVRQVDNAVADAFRIWQARRLPRSRITECLRGGPKHTIVVPVIARSSDTLKRTIDSVTNQLYDHWELILASAENLQTDVLRNVGPQTSRLSICSRVVTGAGLVDACNRAIREAHGAYIGFLDQGHQLTSDALAWMAHHQRKNRDGQWFYSDQVTLDQHGLERDFQYKPDFSTSHLLARHFTNSFAMYRTALLRRCGGLSERDVAPRYGLDLRLAEQLTADQIVHLHRTLYLATPASDTESESEEMRRTVSAFLAERGVSADVTPHPRCPEVHQIRFALKQEPRVSVIIPTCDAFGFLKECIDSMRSTAQYSNYDITVIDHSSKDASLLKYLTQEEHQERLRVVRYTGEFNFSAMNNAVVRHSQSEYLLFVNNDVSDFSAGWLQQLVATAEFDTRVGCVGALLQYPEGGVQHAGILMKKFCHVAASSPAEKQPDPKRVYALQEYSAVTAALMLVRRRVFEEVNGFDTSFPTSFNDIDLCLKLRERGYQCVYNPTVQAVHHESLTRRETRREKEDAQRMRQRWPNECAYDPFHNQNVKLRSLEPIDGNSSWKTRQLAALVSELESCQKAAKLPA